MIVYRDQRFRAESRALIDELRSGLQRLDFQSREAYDSVVDSFILAGTLESAIADSIFSEADGVHPLATALRDVSLGLGHLLWHSWREGRPEAERWRVLSAHRVDAIEQYRLPATVEVTVPEGFAYYSVYPEAYLEAARRCLSRLGFREAVCIGLRSIGAALSAAAAAALEELGCRVRSYTVRPRGHPFARRPILTPGLERLLLEHRHAYYLLVDEGPGISGSSLAGMAQLLASLGVPEDRILLLPSWETDGGQLRSSEARERWPRHRRFTISFDELWIQSGRLARTLPEGSWQELSAGAWRREFYETLDDYPAVQPQHERRKYLLRPTLEPSISPKLLSFSGLGRRSVRSLERAQRLAEAGFTGRPEGVVHGFLVREFVPGTPVRPGESDSALLETVARYLAHLSHHYRAEPSVSTAALREMMEVNVAEALGEEWLEPLRARLPAGTEAWCERAVAVDGRMQAHEWIRCKEGYLKADAFDHHDDHFFPGHQDIAWDLAGAACELGLTPEARHWLVERYRSLSGDYSIAARLPLFSVCYLAFRLGYGRLAAEVLGQAPDGVRFVREADRYGRLLRQELTGSPRVYSHV